LLNKYQCDIKAFVFTFVAMTVVTPFFTFPSIYWWMQVVNAGTVIFDPGEHFEKMTGRNRYKISGANNSILLSVPLVNGRNQHVPMHNVHISNDVSWQLQHWRTLVSVYRRAPYFEHYEETLKPIFENTYTNLIDFNKTSTDWVTQQLKLHFKEEEARAYIKQYPEEVTDLRIIKPGNKKESLTEFPRYYQVFEDRVGFLPNLSILDLLFSEGPHAIEKLKR